MSLMPQLSTSSSSAAPNDSDKSIPLITQNIMNAAMNRQGDLLIALLKHPEYLACTADISPEYMLAKNKDESVCEFLWQHGGNINRMAIGAAAGGHQALAEYFLKHPKNKNPNFNEVAGGAARGGHLALAGYFLKHSKILPNYSFVAGIAADGGHQAIAEYFLEHPENKQPDFALVAGFAARRNHRGIVEYCVNHPQNKEPRLNFLAGTAASCGHQALMEYCLKHPKNKRPDFDWAATNAKHYGHGALAEYIMELGSSCTSIPRRIEEHKPFAPLFSTRKLATQHSTASSQNVLSQSTASTSKESVAQPVMASAGTGIVSHPETSCSSKRVARTSDSRIETAFKKPRRI